LVLHQGILNQAAQISAEIASSDLYQRYLLAQTAVESDENLRDGIAEYKRLQAELHNKHELGEVNFDSEKHVSSVYWGLMLHPAAAEYLRSERELAVLLVGVIEKITDSIELSL